MAKNINKKFIISLDIDTRDAEKQVESTAKNIKNALSKATKEGIGVKELREMANTINSMFEKIGQTGPLNIEQDFKGNGSAAKRIEILTNALDNLFNSMGNVNSQSISAGFMNLENVSSAAKREVDKIKTEVDKIKQLKTDLSNAKKAIDDVKSNKTDVLNNYDVEITDASIQSLISEFNVLSNAIDKGDKKSLDYYKNLLKLSQVSLKLNKAFQDVKSNDSIKQSIGSNTYSDLSLYALTKSNKAKHLLGKIDNSNIDEIIKKEESKIESIIKSDSGSALDTKDAGNNIKKQADMVADSVQYAKNKLTKAYTDYYNEVAKAKKSGVDVSPEMERIENKLYDMYDNWKISNDDQWSLQGVVDNILDGKLDANGIKRAVDTVFKDFDIKPNVSLEELESEAKQSANEISVGLGGSFDQVSKQAIEATEYVKGLEAAIRNMFNAASQKSNIEYKILVNGQNIDARNGAANAVSLKTSAEAYLANLNKDVDIDAHSHQGKSANINVDDLKSAINKHYSGLTKMSAIISDKDLVTLDLTKVKAEDAVKALAKVKEVISQSKLGTIKPEQLNNIFSGIDSNYTDIAKKWDPTKFGELAQYIYNIKQSSEQVSTPLERFKNLLMSITGGKIDFSKYTKQLDSFSTDNIEKLFNEIMKLENITEDGKLLQVDDKVTQGSIENITRDIQRQQEEFLQLRQTAKLTYEDIRAEIDKYMSTGDRSFFNKYYHPSDDMNLADNFTELADGYLDINSLTNKIAVDFGIEPREIQSVEQVSDAYKDLKSSLPNADDFKKTFTPDDDQIRKVRELADEYRIIMSLLSKDMQENNLDNYTYNALQERAKAINDVIQKVRPNDASMDFISDYYGASPETTRAVKDWRTADEVRMGHYNESIITDESRQRAIDLINQQKQAHKENAAAIKEEIVAKSNLNNIDYDDTAADIARENGQLEEKLELLREIADQYGVNITNANRDRYEELNQKDMNDGLTSREEDRFYELGDKIIEADNNLEEFGATYDKITLKLANGKTKDIFPDDTGLRDLYKYADSLAYDEFNGKEIEDVIFTRKQEQEIIEQTNQGLQEQARIQARVAKEQKAASDTRSVDELRQMYDTLKAAHDALPRQKNEQPDSYTYDWSKAKEYVDFEYNGEDNVNYITDFTKRLEAEMELLDKNREAIKSTYKKIREMQNAVNKHRGYLGDDIYNEQDIERAKHGLMGLFEMYDANGGNLDALDIKMTKPFQTLLETTKAGITARKAQQKAYDAETKDIIANNREQIESFEKLYNTTRDAFEASKSKDKKYDYALADLPDIYGAIDYGHYSVGENYDSFESNLKRLGIEIPQAAEKAKQAIKEVDNTKVDPKVDLSTKNELQEIEKQAEKTDTALEELDRQKVSTDVKGDKKGDTKTAVSDDTSKEAQQLEMLDAKLKEVKAAIEAKTQAFREEENIVTAAIGTEVNALNSLESHLESSTQSARAMGSALKDASDLSSVSSSETVSDNKIQDEINALDQLQLKLKEVKSAIEAKTQEFKDEGRIVDGVVDKEIAALNNLSTYLDTIRLNAKSVADSLNQINNTKLNAPTGAVSNNNIDNVHYVTDPQGNKVTMYRGIRGAYGGLVSNRYHGGTFSTDDLNLAKTYAGFTGKVEKVNLSMKNPLEINAKGAYWNQIEYIGNQFDDISRELHTLKENILDAQHSMYFLAQDSDEYQKLQKEMQDNQARVDSIYADPNNPYGITNTNKIVEHAKSMGHDGVIFKNIVDTADSSYYKEAANVMVTFGQDQIHYLDTIQSTFASAMSGFKDKYGNLAQYVNFSKEDVAREMEYARGLSLKNSDERTKTYSEHPFIKDFADFRFINGIPFKEYNKIYNDTADDAFFEEMSKRTYNDIFGMRYELTSIAKAFGKENIPFNELLSENIDSVAEDQSNQKSTSNDKEVLPDNKWALDSTLSTTNSILQSILTAVNGSESTDQISKVLDGAVLDLKAAADALRTSANEVKQESKKGTKSRPKDDKSTISKKIGKEDELTFDEIKNNEISNFEKYKKDVENSIHATDQFKNKLSELELQLKDVNDVESLNTWKQNVEKFQGAFGIHESANKKQLIGEINAINKDAKDAIKGLDLNEPSDDAEKRAAQERIIQGFKEIQIASDICTNSVKKNQYDEISAFNAAKQQLAEKKKQLLEEAAIYRQQYGFMNGGKSGKNYGSTAVMRETTRYNKFKQYASDENQGFKDSALFNEKLQQYINAYDRLIAKRQEISNKSVRTDRDEQEFNDAKQAAADYGKEIDRLIAKSHKLETGAYQIGSIGSDIDIESGLGRKQALTDFVTQMHNAKESTMQFADNYQKCTFKMKNEDGTWTRMTAHLDKFSNKMYSTAGEVTKYGSAFGEFVGALKGEFLKLGRYMIASFGIEEVIQAVRTGIGYVKEIDDALTDLKKVTNETDAGYERFLQTMSKTAAVVGSTVAELTTMAAEWARLGYSMQQAADLAESTAVLLNVSEFEDPTKASEALISTIQAFGYAADDSMHVVDILNEVKVTCLLIQ